jgi:hypothetical protein
MEQFVVETSSKDSRCYDFTSCGAFTTAHTYKPKFMKPIQYLMFYDKPFTFGTTATAAASQNEPLIIENELLLNFYSLKLFIQIGNDLRTLNENPIHSTQVCFLLLKKKKFRIET